jgi:membrane protein DedA with SNARE-associated domain
MATAMEEVLRRPGVRRLLVAMTVSRAALGLLAVPLIPFLYGDHFLLLVLLRPTKEVLLAAGFMVRQGDAALWALVPAALPLLIGAVWMVFLLGRSFRDEADGLELGGPAGKILPRHRIEEIRGLLARRGVPLVAVSRLAAFPHTVLAAAAGTSDLPARRYVAADLAGALVNLVLMLGAGYALGEAYERAGPWVTGLGAVGLLVLVVVAGRHLRQNRRSPRSLAG